MFIWRKRVERDWYRALRRHLLHTRGLTSTPKVHHIGGLSVTAAKWALRNSVRRFWQRREPKRQSREGLRLSLLLLLLHDLFYKDTISHAWNNFCNFPWFNTYQTFFDVGLLRSERLKIILQWMRRTGSLGTIKPCFVVMFFFFFCFVKFYRQSPQSAVFGKCKILNLCCTEANEVIRQGGVENVCCN